MDNGLTTKRHTEDFQAFHLVSDGLSQGVKENETHNDSQSVQGAVGDIRIHSKEETALLLGDQRC